MQLYVVSKVHGRKLYIRSSALSKRALREDVGSADFSIPYSNNEEEWFSVSEVVAESNNQFKIYMAVLFIMIAALAIEAFVPASDAARIGLICIPLFAGAGGLIGHMIDLELDRKVHAFNQSR